MWIEPSIVEHNQHLPPNAQPMGPILVAEADQEIRKVFGISGSGAYAMRAAAPGAPPPYVWLETEGPLVVQGEP